MNYFTLQEVVNRSGLSEHTLRYYEHIGLIDSIDRDHSSGHRRYTDEDIHIIESLACLRSTGMSIEDMRQYLENLKDGVARANEQIELFNAHRQKIESEIAKKQKHLQYLEYKIELWKAVQSGDQKQISEIHAITTNLAKELSK